MCFAAQLPSSRSASPWGAARTPNLPPTAPARGPMVAPGEKSQVLDLGPLVIRIPIGTKIGKITCDPNVLFDIAMEQSTMKLNPRIIALRFSTRRAPKVTASRKPRDLCSQSAKIRIRRRSWSSVVQSRISMLKTACRARPTEGRPGSITGAGLGLLGALADTSRQRTDHRDLGDLRPNREKSGVEDAHDRRSGCCVRRRR